MHNSSNVRVSSAYSAITETQQKLHGIEGAIAEARAQACTSANNICKAVLACSNDINGEIANLRAIAIRCLNALNVLIILLAFCAICIAAIACKTMTM